MHAREQKTRHPRSRKTSFSPAREAAFQVLQQVTAGQFASDALRVSAASLTSRDAGLAGQIVFGVLRRRGQLDRLISQASVRPADRLDAAVLDILRTALFQIYFLDRVPARAAVHEAVELAKQHRRAASGLVNAVLRRASEAQMTEEVRDDPSCPPWLLARWSEHFGPETGLGIARAALDEPPTYVRIAAGPHLDTHPALRPTDVPGAWLAPDSETAAAYTRQDLGAQSIVPLLDLQPGMAVLDLCSAPGNKTLQMLEFRPRLLVACDVSRRRLAAMPTRFQRVLLDGTMPLPFRPGTFDRILVDAPCSGTGTLAHNPEIKWRLQPDDLPVFSKRQSALVESALAVLKPGGHLVYSTCSLEREENEEVTVAILKQHPRVRLLTEQYRIPGREPGDGFYAAALNMLP